MGLGAEGRVRDARRFFLRMAGAVCVLSVLVSVFLAGMVVGIPMDDGAAGVVAPVPMALAEETGVEGSAGARRDAVQEERAWIPAGLGTEYSTCLVRTYRTLRLDLEDAGFMPWPESGWEHVWDVIEHRGIDYVSGRCRDLAPEPLAYSGTCVPREMQSFYRRHVPEGAGFNGEAGLAVLAGEYALTVCRPSAAGF